MRTRAGIEGGSSVRPIKRDHGVSVTAPVPVAWQRFRRAMLDAENTGERTLDPVFGDCLGLLVVVRRIGKRDVVRIRVETFDETQRIGSMNHRRRSRFE